jgi:AraC family transcriptional regulator
MIGSDRSDRVAAGRLLPGLESKGGLMISALNQLVDLVEEHLAEELDVDRLAGSLGTTEYHLRRMFSSLAGMPLSA